MIMIVICSWHLNVAITVVVVNVRIGVLSAIICVLCRVNYFFYFGCIQVAEILEARPPVLHFKFCRRRCSERQSGSIGNSQQTALWLIWHPLAPSLSDLDCREVALEISREAAKIYQKLILWLSFLINNLFDVLSSLGHREDALEVIQEAVIIRRQLVSLA